MRITLNLASKPFIELRPLYARLRWWMAILLILAIPLWLFLKTETRKAALANAKLQAVETSIQRLQNQQRSYQAMMQQPQNAAVLTQAAFLNQLFARKAFSWTAVMMDLETVLPGGVQVMNIDPATDKSGNVTIRLRVSGQRDRAVELVRNLEHSRRFLQPRLATESADTSNSNGGQANLQPASGTGNVNFDVLADYNPLLPESKRPAKTTTAKAVGPAATAPSAKSHRNSSPRRPTPAQPQQPQTPGRPTKGAQ
ncbi:putative secretion system W transmembrane protein 1 [Acidisarcina polymorpha]|uniref:Putative secretion system W transmembrane protein 1 n=1 Tax=Acidisarcina polymorpha TaxID=2211140 RepID=A0A2Z5G8I5_9BACT|nr:PilN domain-containing protein [Acidisarcina polymorpha]AXC14965.1 putative secretion system W transmembrane protein 1 [Acidisarcina polymorpha]